jgi:hypothetical protein
LRVTLLREEPVWEALRVGVQALEGELHVTATERLVRFAEQLRLVEE